MRENIKAGSIIYHKPSMKKLLVLGVDKFEGEVCIAGWPSAILKVVDCEFVEQQELRQDQISFRENVYGSRFKE